MSVMKAALFAPFESDSIGVVCDDLMTAAKELGIDLAPLEGQYLSEPVISTILRATEESAFAVAVLDETNPNVLFEVGYALGVDRPLVLVSREDAKVPFDVEAFERVHYVPRQEYRDENRKRFKKAFETTLSRLKVRHRRESKDMPLRMRRALGRLQIADGPHLFRVCALHTLDAYVASVDAWQARLRYEGRENVLRMGVLILKNLERSGFATLYLPGEDSWQADDYPKTSDEYLRVTREVARRGIPITRVYVVPTEDALQSTCFRRLVLDDAASGIDTRYIIEDKFPADAPKDFGVWDDELVGVVEYARRKGAHHISATTFYYLDEDLTRARTWIEGLRDAPRCTGLPTESAILERTYRKQEDMANLRHESGSVDSKDASWYHAGREYLRLCDSVACPRWHRDFFSSSIRAWLESSVKDTIARRVLITGLADCGMLYEVLGAFGPARLEERSFEVLDLSSVPTEMCKELVRILQEDSNGSLYVNLKCHENVDLLANNLQAGHYDMIATDAFLTRFDTDRTKEAVVKEWNRLLRPGGLLVTTARLSDERDAASGEALETMRSGFVQRAVQAWPPHLDQDDCLRLEAHARNYAQRMTSYPFDGTEAVRKLFRQGWDLGSASFKTALTRGEFCGATYVRIRINKAPHRAEADGGSG